MKNKEDNIVNDIDNTIVYDLSTLPESTTIDQIIKIYKKTNILIYDSYNMKDFDTKPIVINQTKNIVFMDVKNNKILLEKYKDE